jgi:hypothetical protein
MLQRLKPESLKMTPRLVCQMTMKKIRCRNSHNSKAARDSKCCGSQICCADEVEDPGSSETNVDA